MISVQLMLNNLVSVQCRRSGLRCCFAYTCPDVGTIELGNRQHGDLRPSVDDVRRALVSKYSGLGFRFRW